MSSIKPTIYLVKKDVKKPKDIFKVKGLSQQEKDGFIAYYKKSNKNTPEWAHFLGETMDISTKFFENSSSFAVLTMTVNDRMFAIPLGMGIHLIDMAKMEYNFGLRTAINAIPKTEIRQIDTTKPEANSQKTRKLASLGTTPEGFEINKEKDILRGIVGKIPMDINLGDVLDGKDSLRVYLPIDSLVRLKKVVNDVYELHQSIKYKEDYPWIDNMSLVRDRELVGKLNKLLIKELKTGKLDEIYFVPPVFFGEDFNSNGFTFSTGNRMRLSNKMLYEMPSMLDWKKEIGKEERNKISENTLDGFKVHEFKETGKSNSWPLQRCLSWETSFYNQKYILSEGSWYEVSDVFYKEVNDYFANRLINNSFPIPSKSKMMEADYNKEICLSLAKGHLFDLGHPDAIDRGLGKDKNEACDVYDSTTNTFIHVKIGKSSSSLSHLFSQGGYSGLILRQDDKVLDQFNSHLVKDKGIALNKPYLPSNYNVLFVSVIGKKQKKDIPFFSKVTFYNTVQKSLNYAGYKCNFTFVVLP